MSGGVKQCVLKTLLPFIQWSQGLELGPICWLLLTPRGRGGAERDYTLIVNSASASLVSCGNPSSLGNIPQLVASKENAK